MLKVVEKIHNPLSSFIFKRGALLKNEDMSYVSAFLTSVRCKLLSAHSQSLSNYPTRAEVDLMYKDIYKDLDELYIDEHWTMANNDYLEQCYDLFSNIHRLIRKYDLVYDLKLEENRAQFLKNNPNDFPIYDLSSNNKEPFNKTIWELDPSLEKQLEEMTGFTLNVKKSKIEHPGKYYTKKIDAENGVFLSCPQRKFVLPGTLLGFYPGVLGQRYNAPQKLEMNTTLPYLRRYDGTWVDANMKVPYPITPYTDLDKFYSQEEISVSVKKNLNSVIVKAAK